MKVAIITPYSMNPPSMRILQIKGLLEKIGATKIEIIHTTKGNGSIKRILELRKKCSILEQYDYYIIYDLLTLVGMIDFLFYYKNKTIYDAIDYFPGYYSYKAGLRGILLKIGIFTMSKLEYFLAKRVIQKVMVNSPFLEKYFHGIPQLSRILYNSPFEGIGLKNNYNNKNIAIVYLGMFTIEKGAKELIEFANNHYDLKVFIIGDWLIEEDNLPNNIVKVSRLNKKELIKKLKDLLGNYYLLGFSCIHTSNPSYAVQEANKDIDYLCCGIPILGNTRFATKEKIMQGAGIFYNDSSKIEEVVNSNMYRKKLADKAQEIYIKYYHSKNSLNSLKKLIGS